jgi:hypothetical protein
MYIGVRSYESAARCHDYESARRTLERTSVTPKRKLPRAEQQFGYHLGMGTNHGVTWVREMRDEGYEGAIAFRLYDTDVVIWHPDNSVEIDNFGTVTTGGFARTFLPSGLDLCHPVERRNGPTGGHKGIRYCVEQWHNGRYMQGTYNLCFGGLPRFRQHGEHWLPDEDTLDEIEFPEIADRKAQRAVAQKYSLRDFDNWLAMAPLLMRIEHDEWDIHECADALLKRDFDRAAAFLPLTHDTGAYGTDLKIIPIVTSSREHHVTVSAIAKLKLALWDLEGLVETVSFKTISRAEFDRRMRRVKQMQALGLCGYDLGPPRW